MVSRTLSGMFLVGPLNRLRKRKRTNPEIPNKIGKIPQKRAKIFRKKDKSGPTIPNRETCLKNPSTGR